jgi:hypothetical protein
LRGAHGDANRNTTHADAYVNADTHFDADRNIDGDGHGDA